VGDAGQDEPVHVGQDGVEGLALLGRLNRQAGADVAGCTCDSTGYCSTRSM
jgi:hypothetical protein